MNVQCLTLCALCFCIGLQSHGQLKIGGDPYQIHPYALLELESSERALVLPRLSTAERDRSFTHSIPVGMVFFILIHSNWRCGRKIKNGLFYPIFRVIP